MEEDIICYDVDGDPGCFHKPDAYCNCECHLTQPSFSSGGMK